MDKGLVKRIKEERSLSRLDELEELQPWDQLPGEPANDYELFLQYMLMGPTRSMRKLLRNEMIAANELLPGEPLPNVPSRLTRIRARWDWINRANAWDHCHWNKMVNSHQESLTQEIADMVDEHVEGIRLFRKAAILGIYARDDDGNILCDANGVPQVKIPQDESTAWRIFKQAVEAERTATGMPTNISIMTNRQIEERILEIKQNLGDEVDLDNIVEGEFVESDVDRDGQSGT